MAALCKILGKQSYDNHPTGRQKHHLVIENVLLRKVAPQTAACTGHFNKLIGSPIRKNFSTQLWALVSHTAHI